VACDRSRVRLDPPFFFPGTLTASRLNRYVALKIVTSESNCSGEELKILKHLFKESQQHPGKSYVMTLLDSFEHRGPNGVHECFVFEVMGPSAGSYTRNFLLETAQPSSSSNETRKQFEQHLLMVKSILRQILLGIDFLHTCGIAHSDLQPGNILVSIKDLSLIEESQLAQYDEDGAHFVKVPDSSHERFVRTYKDDRPSDAAELIPPSAKAQKRFHVAELNPPSAKRQKTSRAAENSNSTQGNPSSLVTDSLGLPGELDRPLNEDSKPRYLAMKRPLDNFVDLASPIEVKISDMGGAFFLSSPPETPVTPINMRSPELVLGHPISQDQDIWSFGCLVFELITGRPLFSVDPFDYGTMMDSIEDEDGCAENGDDRKHDIGNGDDKDHPIDFQEDRQGEREADTEQKGNTEKEKNERIDPAIPQDKEDENDFCPDADHLQQFACALRPLPPSILSQWPKASRFFDQNGEAKYVKGVKGDDIPPWYSLEVLFDHEDTVDISAAERAAVLHLIRHILQYEPQKRPSVSELLQHPWFAEADVEDGSGGARA